MDEAAAADAIAAFERMRAEQPEEKDEKIIKRILEYVIPVGRSIRKAQTDLVELCTLREQIATTARKLQPESGKETILEVLDFHKKNASQELIESYCKHFRAALSPVESLDELYEGVQQDRITNHEDTKKLILDSMKTCQQDKSDQVITNMVTESALVAVSQTVNIYKTWKRISNASNVIMESRNEFNSINRNLEKMEGMVTKFLDLCERNPTDSRVGQKMVKINTLFTSTLGKISNLRVKIDGNIQRLDLIADNSVIDGVVNAAKAVTIYGFQVWQTWEHLSSYNAFLGSVMTALFGVFGLANFTEYYLSQNTLKDLRKGINEVLRLQDMLENLHERAAQALDEIPEQD